MARKTNASLRNKRDLLQRKKMNGGAGWTRKIMQQLAERKAADDEQKDV